MTTTRNIEKQAKPIRDLIEYARQRDALGKHAPSRAQLIAALTTLGRTRQEAELEVENARRRVRKAANKADEWLDFHLRNTSLWPWTHPREAIKHLRARAFGIAYRTAPLTDIEEGLVSKGNVLLAVAAYPALEAAIWKRLRQMSLEAREAADEAPEARPSSGNDAP